MIGRAAQGRPWIFREIDHYLRTGEKLAPPSYGEMRELLLEHLDDHYRFMASTPAYARRASISAGIWKACRTRTRSATA